MRIIKADKQYKVPQIDLHTFIFGKFLDESWKLSNDEAAVR
jgi:hypothetical protein